jgi:hypothetical protein
MSLVNNDNGFMNYFLVKFGPSGNDVWAKTNNCHLNEEGTALATDSLGNIYLGGYFLNSEIIFGSQYLSNSGIFMSQEIFITKFSSSGTAQWAKVVHSENDDYISELAADNDGNIYAAIHYRGTSASLDTLTLANTSGGYHICLAKIGQQSTSNIDNDILHSALISPNPFSSRATIVFEKYIENAQLTVEDMLGRKLAEINGINGNAITLNRGNLPSGFYMMRIMEGNKVLASEKFIVED